MDGDRDVSCVGICILMEGMVVECVEIIEAGVEKMEVGTNVVGLEKVVRVGELSSCDTKY